MLPTEIHDTYGASEIERRLLARRRVETVRPLLGKCWQWTGATTIHGYGRVSLSPRHHYAHRLAAMIWLDYDPGSGLVVCHHCDNPGCFNPAHLYLASHRQNIQDAAEKGRVVPPRHDVDFTALKGKENPGAKLSEVQVTEIRRVYAEGMSQERLAAQFGVSQKLISLVVTGKLWRHLLPDAA